MAIRKAFYWMIPMVLACALEAHAHNPVAVNSAPSGPENAFQLQAPTISQVVYHTVSDEAPTVWMRFNAEANQRIEFEAGVPVLSRMINLRPAIAVVGPGLPSDVEVPFEIPAGMGVRVFDTEEQALPPVFSEPFTGTQDWIYDGFSTRVPQQAEYFLVGYFPRGENGKIIVVIGTEERFTFQDIIRLPRITKEVRAFHEIPAFGGAILWMPLILFFSLITLILTLIFTG